MLFYFQKIPLRKRECLWKHNEQLLPVDPLNEIVSHAEFRAAFQALAQAVAANVWANNRASIANQQGGDMAAARIHDFVQMNHPKFYGSKIDEDSQLYLEKVRKITDMIHISKEKSVELAFYRLKDIAYDWVVSWKKGRGLNVASMTQQVFQDAFLDQFFPLDMRKEKIEKFTNMREGSMTIKEQCLTFNQFAKYAPDLIFDTWASMSKFMIGVSGLVLKEYRIAMLNKDMDISKQMIHTQQIEVDKLREREDER